MGDKIVNSVNLCCQPVVFPRLSLLIVLSLFQPITVPPYPFSIIAIGNPGCGKSAALNYLAQRNPVAFKSGISIGSGLTSVLDECTVGNITYKDTPGLNDICMIKKAGEEISKALKVRDFT